MKAQSIRFEDVNGRRIAIGAVGSGPPVILGGWWMSDLEHDWRNPRFRRFMQALGRYRTVIRYDRPGAGLSGGEGSPQTIEAEAEVLAGVIDALRLERIDLYAGSSGGAVACALAVERPELIERLVLYGSYANGAEIADESARQSLLSIVGAHWGLGSRVLTDVFMPTADATERAAFTRFQRQVASPELAARSLASVYSFDVRDRLEHIRAPTEVIHRRDDTAIPSRLGLELASAIPGASLSLLEGSEHFPWRGRAGEVARAILEGLGVQRPEVDFDDDAEEAPAAQAAESDLSARELEVLRLVALGRSDREIATELVLSPHTVHRHVANIRNKLRLPSRAAAAAHAARLGLL